MIVSVERQGQGKAFVGEATDAPLKNDVWAYRESVRIGGTAYVGYYKTATSYFPATWTPSHRVELRIEKKQMYLRTAGGEDIKMQIVSRRRVPVSIGG